MPRRRNTPPVTVDTLADVIGSPHPRPSLLCATCGALYSADRGDYWGFPRDHVLTCCGRNLALVTARTTYVPVAS